MDVCKSPRLSPGKGASKTYVAVALGVVIVVATVVLAVVIPTVLCQSDVGSMMARNSSAWLEKELIITNQSLAEARGQWEGCREQLGGKVLELEQALANVTQLQVDNQALRRTLVQQQEQLEELQSSRDKLQMQNRLLQEQLQDTLSHSGGDRLLAMFLSLLTLLLPGMLLL